MGINKHLEMRELAQKNLNASIAYLAQNEIKPYIITLASGLQYRILEQGDNSQQPDDNSTVSYHLRGQLTDGRIFENTRQEGKPSSIALKDLIPGLREGIKLMKVGDVFEFYLPPDLAYGDRPVNSTIGPNVVLIFRVELLAIK